MNTCEKDIVLDILFQSDVHLTAPALIRQIKTKLAVSSANAKKIIKSLVDDQTLTYQYFYGNTYIVKSFLKPVQITDHFLLTPRKIERSETADTIPIIVEPGISFGSGEHPTTCLCLEALEMVFFEEKLVKNDTGLVCADVGTGSGVLALAVCLAAPFHCDAYEIDALSVNEAKKTSA
jgi:ribosomal protein L11 methyltransferase